MPDIFSGNSPILLIKLGNKLNTGTVMANSPQGRPADFVNLSPFAANKSKSADPANQSILLLGVVGILAAIVLVFFALMLKAA